MSSKNKRTATITRTIVQADGSKTYENFGAVISSQFPGVYSLIEEVETGETGENGYPERRSEERRVGKQWRARWSP